MKTKKQTVVQSMERDVKRLVVEGDSQMSHFVFFKRVVCGLR